MREQRLLESFRLEIMIVDGITSSAAASTGIPLMRKIDDRLIHHGAPDAKTMVSHNCGKGFTPSVNEIHCHPIRTQAPSMPEFPKHKQLTEPLC